MRIHTWSTYNCVKSHISYTLLILYADSNIFSQWNNMLINAEDRPIVTVIILTYNDMSHCLNALQSVLTQTFKAISVIVVDNGSTDSTWNALQHFSSDSRVTLHKQPRNQRSDGVQAVTGKVETEYISFLFADDTYRPERISHAIAHLRDNPNLDYLFYNNAYCDEHGNTVRDVHFSWFSGDISSMDRWQHLYRFFNYGNTLHPCGMVVKTEVYNLLGGFKNFMHRMGDMVFFTKLLAHGEGVFLPNKMQNITIWNSQKNESFVNFQNETQFYGERTLFLDEFIQPAIIDNLVKIFGTRQASDIALDGEAAKYWYLAHQALRPSQRGRPESFLFGLRLLYRVADIADGEFETQIIKITGFSLSEYLYHLIDRSSVIPAPSPHPLKVKLKKRLPFLVPIYRLLKGRPLSD